MTTPPQLTTPALATDRLLLRPLEAADRNEIFTLLSDPAVNRYYGQLRGKTVEDADNYIRSLQRGSQLGKVAYWAICRQGEQSLAGTICLWNYRVQQGVVETGFELLPSCWGQGLMQEALKKVIDFAFGDLQVPKIDAWPNCQNAASIKLLQKCGFARDTAAEQLVDWSKEADFYKDAELNGQVTTWIFSQANPRFSEKENQR